MALERDTQRLDRNRQQGEAGVEGSDLLAEGGGQAGIDGRAIERMVGGGVAGARPEGQAAAVGLVAGRPGFGKESVAGRYPCGVESIVAALADGGRHG